MLTHTDTDRREGKDANADSYRYSVLLLLKSVIVSEHLTACVWLASPECNYNSAPSDECKSILELSWLEFAISMSPCIHAQHICRVSNDKTLKKMVTQTREMCRTTQSHTERATHSLTETGKTQAN